MAANSFSCLPYATR